MLFWSVCFAFSYKDLLHNLFKTEDFVAAFSALDLDTLYMYMSVK